MALGLLLNTFPLSYAALVLIVLYCAYYGITEAVVIPSFRPPGSSWQVPQSLVLGTSRRRRILVWGAILGPGLATRNPYAGFGMLPLAVAAIGNVSVGVLTAAAIGAAHGTGRALALLRDASGIGNSDYFRSVLRSMHWRRFDGLAILVIGGLAMIACVHGGLCETFLIQEHRPSNKQVIGLMAGQPSGVCITLLEAYSETSLK